MANDVSLLDMTVVMSFLITNGLIVRFGMWPYSLTTFPGTLAHELAHYFAALIFFASPSFPNIIPRRNGDSWTMGTVAFVPTLINSIPIALAPLLLLPAGLLFTAHVMHPAKDWDYLFYGWISGNMMYACLPSRQDWKIAMPALLMAVMIWLLITILLRE